MRRAVSGMAVLPLVSAGRMGRRRGAGRAGRQVGRLGVRSDTLATFNLHLYGLQKWSPKGIGASGGEPHGRAREPAAPRVTGLRPRGPDVVGAGGGLPLRGSGSREVTAAGPAPGPAGAPRRLGRGPAGAAGGLRRRDRPAAGPGPA